MIDSILAFPKSMRNGNTIYTRDLYRGLAKLGVETSDYNRYFPHRPSASCFHFHWPDRVAGGLGRFSPLLRERAIKNFSQTIESYRRKRKPVFWTVHNDQPHDFRVPEFAQAYDKLMGRIVELVDGFVFLNSSSRNRFLNLNTLVRPETCIVIPQMLPDMEGVTPKAPPEVLGNAPMKECFLIPGQIRAHKLIPRAIAIYQSICQDGDRLVIAGPPIDRTYLQDIRSLICGDPTITLIPRALTDAEMLFLFDRAKAVFALNAGDKNSAVMFTALARGRRVIVNKGPVSDEIVQSLGGDMIVSAEADPDTIKSVLNKVLNTISPSEISLSSVSEAYLSFFNKVSHELHHS